MYRNAIHQYFSIIAPNIACEHELEQVIFGKVVTISECSASAVERSQWTSRDPFHSSLILYQWFHLDDNLRLHSGRRDKVWKEGFVLYVERTNRRSTQHMTVKSNNAIIKCEQP
jgi:hypothetical protein